MSGDPLKTRSPRPIAGGSSQFPQTATKLHDLARLISGFVHEMSNPLGFVQANLLQLADTLDDFARLHDAATALRSELGQATAPNAEALAAFDDALSAAQPKQALKDSDAAIRESLEGARRIRSSLYDLHGLLGVRASGEAPELAEVVTGAIQALRGVTSPELAVKTELVPEIRASGSAAVLRKIIVTLLLRAAEAVAEAARGQAAEVRVYAGRRGGEICLSITDTGVPLRARKSARPSCVRAPTKRRSWPNSGSRVLRGNFANSAVRSRSIPMRRVRVSNCGFPPRRLHERSTDPAGGR